MVFGSFVEILHPAGQILRAKQMFEHCADCEFFVKILHFSNGNVDSRASFPTNHKSYFFHPSMTPSTPAFTRTGYPVVARSSAGETSGSPFSQLRQIHQEWIQNLK